MVQPRMIGYPHGLLSDSSVKGLLLHSVEITRPGMSPFTSGGMFLRQPDGSLLGRIVDRFGTARVTGQFDADELHMVLAYNELTKIAIRLSDTLTFFKFVERTERGWSGTYEVIDEEYNVRMAGAATCTLAVTELDVDAVHSLLGI